MQRVAPAVEVFQRSRDDRGTTERAEDARTVRLIELTVESKLECAIDLIAHTGISGSSTQSGVLCDQCSGNVSREGVDQAEGDEVDRIVSFPVWQAYRGYGRGRG
jgi:hypothetical protein